MGSDQVKGSPNGALKCFEFGHRNKAGEPCGANVIKGTRGCWRHAGKSRRKAKAQGAVVVELRRWGLDGQTELADPGETLLRLVTQSRARCDLYADLVRQAYEAAERLRHAEAAPQSDLLEAETARLDLERVLNRGGVAALIGHTYSGTQQNGVIATGERIRGLVDLELQERKLCADFAAKAVAAGLAERMVRIAEQMGAQLAAVLGQAVQALGHDPGSPEVRRVIEGAVASVVDGPKQIEGRVAA